MEIKFKTKIVVLYGHERVKNTTPCPHKRTTFYSSQPVMVGDMSCMRCPFLEKMDWDNNVCYCKKEKPKKDKETARKTAKKAVRAKKKPQKSVIRTK